MFKVVCVGAFHRKGIELLESRPDLVTYEVLTDLSPENVARGVAGADAVVVRTTPLPLETLERADHLRIVSRHGVGTEMWTWPICPRGKSLWPSPSTPTWGPWPNTRS